MGSPRVTRRVNVASLALPITLTGSAANPAGTVRYIGGEASTSILRLNVPTGGDIRFSCNGTANATFTSSGLTVGFVGFAARPLEVFSNSTAQLRLSYTVASVFQDLTCNSGGYLVTSGSFAVGSSAFGSFAFQVSGTSYMSGSLSVQNKVIMDTISNNGAILAGGITYSGSGWLTMRTNAANGTSSGIMGAYYDSTAAAYRSAWEIVNLAGLGNLQLMPAGGTITLGGSGGFAVLGGGAGLKFTNATKLTPSGTVPILYGDTEAHLWLPTGSNFYIRTATSGGAEFFVSDTITVGTQIKVNGVLKIQANSTGLGFFAVTPVARAAAYTQTYATATRTHNNVTSSAVVTTAATLAAYGFTQAQADAIPVAINAVAADLLNLKQLVNSLIDDGQAYGLQQ